jgi:subtilisin family serine protease
MERREFIVSLKADVNYDQFWHEMESSTNQHPFVPDHAVDIVNNRPGSTRSCHYALTEQEADVLRNDPRVYSVEIPPDQRTDIEIGLTNVQTGNFTKTYTSTGDFKNWGLRRCISYTDPYSGGLSAPGDYSYLYDGTGVDIVIQDSGIEVTHPEFNDSFGNSRVQQINWYTESGLPGTQSANHYRDFDGHGTHVAGIASGKTFGWGKNARIYSLKVRALEGAGDTDPSTGQGSGIVIADCFDVIKNWHINKPIDPVLGVKRPTIVNMSWGYTTTYTNITGGYYRGASWVGTSRRTDYGMIGSLSGATRRGNVRVGSVDTDIAELIAAGVTVVIAAGNNYEKIDVSGGLDYGNYWTSSVSGNIYYHRGSSPYDNNAIIVGSIKETTAYPTEVKSAFSNHGPGVTTSAPGSYIMSATSQTNAYLGVAYHENAAYKQVNISGTSMASPQVAGVLSLYLQQNPSATPAQVKSWLTSTTIPGQDRIYTTGLNDDYTDEKSTWGGNQNYVFWPFSTPIVTHRASGIQIKGPVTFKMG